MGGTERTAFGPDLVRRFKEDGYVCIPGFLDDDTLAGIRARIARIRDGQTNGIPKERFFFETKGVPETLKQVQELYRWDAYFHALMFSGRAVDLAKVLLEDKAVPVNMQYFNKPPSVGKPTPPHQDGFYFMLQPCEAVTMWVALEPIDRENGCVRYLKGSHKAGLQDHSSTDVLGFSQAVDGFQRLRDEYEEVAFPAAPGTLLAHHALTVHRADANRSKTRTRQALGLIYYAARAKVDAERHAAYQRKLAAEMTRAGRL